MYCRVHKADLGSLLECQQCLRDDAMRYRWLRDKSLGQWDHPIVVEQQRVDQGMKYIGPLAFDRLDAAIDASMASPCDIRCEDK